MTPPAERQLPPTCPHCGTSIVLAAPHCRSTAGMTRPTCTWVICPCKAVIDPMGRHTHHDHKPGITCTGGKP